MVYGVTGPYEWPKGHGKPCGSRLTDSDQYGSVRFNAPFVEKGEKIDNFSRKLGQDGVFMLRECAQSISVIKLPPIESFFVKINFFQDEATK